jgi:hypothetical protein
MNFDLAKEDSRYTISSGAEGDGCTGLLIATEHVPLEFERDTHFLLSENDDAIEAEAQFSAASLAHVHASTPCGCAAIEVAKPYIIDCSAASTQATDGQVQVAWSFLTDDANKCKESCDKGSECGEAFQLVQAHHDFCDYSAMPTGIETGFHSYESVCNKAGCAISRMFIDDLPQCDDPVNGVGPIECLTDEKPNPDQTTVRIALEDKTNDCNSACGGDTCKKAFMKVLYYHDKCAADEIEEELEIGLHAYEGTCTKNGLAACNVAAEAFSANECKGVSNLDKDGKLKPKRARRAEFQCPAPPTKYEENNPLTNNRARAAHEVCTRRV